MKKQKLAKVSPWILAAACTLLFLIIGVFAVNNYRREKKLMGEALLQKGITIIRFVMTSSRASLRGSVRNIHFAMWEWSDHVQQAIDHTSDQPGILFVALVDSDGHILASSEKKFIKKKVDGSTLVFLNNLKTDKDSIGKFRISTSSVQETSAFQVASIYSPLGLRSIIPKLAAQGMDFNSTVDRLLRRHPEYQRIKLQLEKLRSTQFTLLVELDLASFNQAVKQQLFQIIILSFVLLLVGVGGWISLLTFEGLKGSQNRLDSIRAFTDLLISSLPVGLIATDRHGNIRLCNNVAELIVGIPETQILGQPPDNTLPDEMVKMLSNKKGDLGLPEQKEISLLDSSQKRHSLLLAGISVMDNEKQFAGNMLLIQDLSKIKDLEEEVRRHEKLAALGKMAAGLAHELRNPLSSIKGLAVLLRSKLEQKSQDRRNADILVQEVERLNRSIGELLDFARPHKLQKENVVLSQILDRSILLIRMDAEATKVKMSFDNGDKEIKVYADPDKLTQVFLNLFLNALQAMPEGGDLRISTHLEKSTVVCEIQDTGFGLNREDEAKVFDPYFTTKNDGTGLGLALSLKIIEEHSGSIRFKSNVGVGTTVTVTLPLLRRG